MAGRRARQSEEEGAKIGGGRRVPGSGSRWFAKGDIRENGFLIEDKFTDADSYRLTKGDWLKITAQATRTPPGMLPMFRITIPGLPKLRVLREDDYIFLEAMAMRRHDGDE